ncbi:probable disease resistance protein At5g63020 [Prosopis cineraria]|uniref:probable disease resistance protein At5g63020 n=1 Tax=Prosopis cineraria TaxID=364024 RepID=UPI00240F6EAA|nr:probable disease resistance protein At5g63020 [Prosopis cineraria]
MLDTKMDPSSFVGVIREAAKCFCGCVKQEADFVFDLENNLQKLEDQNRRLEDIKKDVEAQIEEADNNPEMQISHQLTAWLQRVETLQQKIKDIEAQGDQEIQSKCFSKRCSKDCMSSYKLGKIIAKKLKDVDELTTEGKSFGKDFKIAHKVPLRANEMPQDEVVGLDLMVDKVWNSIEAKNVGVIGLYGMGGVGKIILLKKINNEPEKRRLDFDVVMWVVVLKEPNLDNIMDNIRKQVGIDYGIWNSCSNQDDKAAKIYRVLEKKKFVLLLDDIWDTLDLKLMVGVPHPKETNFQCKMLCTTRSEDVYAKTLKLTKKMAKEYKRLPLVLIVVGSAMAGVKILEAWEHFISKLTSSSFTAPNLKMKVLSVLKFSYDRLDEVHKSCFLYCALYPKDCEILVPDLIDKWMWEKCFVKLEYLSLPMEDIPRAKYFMNLLYLINLKFLSLWGYEVMEWNIPMGVVSSLEQLKVFRLDDKTKINREGNILEELESLPDIEELCIRIRSQDSLSKLFNSIKLQSCTCSLSIQVSHATWLRHAPLLQELVILGCESMEQVIKEKEEATEDEDIVDSSLFLSLVTLELSFLPKLKSIHKATLPFPSLKSITIYDCPELKKLPLDSNSAKLKLTLIQGPENWWNNLEWDDHAAKQIFQSKFKAY